MISASDRREAIKLIEEAVCSGARRSQACSELGITARTWFRWVSQEKQEGLCEDRRPASVHPDPKNKIPANIRKKIIEICNEPEFASMPPCEIVPALADRGTYIASESTFYRVLKEEKMLNHRGRAEAPKRDNHPTTYAATGPDQVWMWDITYLNGPHKGMYYYLYLFSDLYDRSIVGWEVYEEESAEHASELVRRISLAQGRFSTTPLVLHSDNGSPMKGATMLATLYQLGITPSNSRPRVSNDNPYAESLFKTLKYRPNYQPKGFSTLDEARVWVKQFVSWYNYEHHHSGIRFLTPFQRRTDGGHEILENRKRVYEEAKAKYPERWNGRPVRNWTLPDIVYLNPEIKVTVTNISGQKEARVS